MMVVFLNSWIKLSEFLRYDGIVGMMVLKKKSRYFETWVVTLFIPETIGLTDIGVLWIL